MLVLLLAAALVSQPIDPRITHPWMLTVSIDFQGTTYTHSESYRTFEQCQHEQQLVAEATAGVPSIVHLTRCDFVGLV